MSVFASSVTETLPVPGAPEHSITIRKLAPKHLRAAQRASQLESLQSIRDMGGPAFLKELRGLSEKDVQSASSANPMLLYDASTLLDKGIVAWTFIDKPLVGTRESDVKGEPPISLRYESIEDLDEQTSEWLARAVLKLAKPGLFTEAEAEQKNG